MREVEYKDPDGRQWAMWLPANLPDSDAHLGIFIGPPPVDALDLPEAVAIRLHNELYRRRIFTAADAIRHREDVAGAVRAALSVSVHDVLELYRELPDPVVPE